MHNPRLSVIVPGCNTPESWWRRCLDSILASAPDAEIICIDDGSLDGAKFLDDWNGIIVIHQSNSGPSVARNRGLERASGEWVTFVDSDDEVLPGFYSAGIRKAEEDGSDIVVCGVDVVWPDDGLRKYDTIPDSSFGELEPQDVKRLADSCLLNYIWNKIFRRSFIESNTIRFPLDAVMGEDLIFNFTCIEAHATWSAIERLGYRYYRTRGTLLSRFRPKLASGLRHYSDVWRRYKESHPDGRLVLGAYGEINELKLKDAEWRNLWMPSSPVSLWERWKMRPGVPFLKMLVYTLIRRWCYIRPVRRRHILRMFPMAKELNAEDWG